MFMFAREFHEPGFAVFVRTSYEGISPAVFVRGNFTSHLLRGDPGGLDKEFHEPGIFTFCYVILCYGMLYCIIQYNIVYD